MVLKGYIMELKVCRDCHSPLCVKKVSIFEGLKYEDLIEIMKLTGHKTLKKGECLCHEGDVLDTLFIVNDGKVKLSKFNVEGKEQILRILSSGDIFGEYHLFVAGEPYNYTATTLSNTKICTLSKEKMDYLLRKHPHLSSQLLAEVSKKLIVTENLVQNLSNVQTDAKIAYILLELAEKYGLETDKGTEINLPLTREELANYAGVTRETMSRRLTILAHDHIIETIGYKKIIIKDFEALNKFF